MNTRDYKQFRQDQIYHVYNRGHNKQDIFFTKEDYKGFLTRTAILLNNLDVKTFRYKLTPFDRSDFSILAYCLLPNHFHFLIRQNGEVPVNQFIARLTTSYAKFFNLQNNREGSVFRSKFRAKNVLTDNYFLTVSAYIHLNPLDPFNYEFSSLKEYQTENYLICDPTLLLDYFNNSYKEYENYLKTLIDNRKALEFSEMN